MRGEPRIIAGHAAAWTRVELDVRGDTDAYVAAPVELYALSDPEKSIDAGALLRERVIADPPYWALVWTGARAIAAVVASMELPAGRILDLGCGLGLAGLAAAKRGANVTFGDYLDEPLEFVRATLAETRDVRHGLTESGLSGDDPRSSEKSVPVPDFHGRDCEVVRIDFTSEKHHGLFDLVLAADIVYDPAHYAPLASFLERSLAPGGTILLTESLRADASVFLEGMYARGFRDDRQALWVVEEGRRERTWLHVLTRAA